MTHELVKEYARAHGWTEGEPISQESAEVISGDLVWVLRWLSDNAPTREHGEFIEHAWTSEDLDRLADEIERAE